MNINFNMQRNAYTAYGSNANEGCPSSTGSATEGKTFADMNVGNMGIKSTFGGGEGPSFQGFGVDLDGDGKFSGDKDGVLAFDTNKDGKIDIGEMQASNRILKTLSGKTEVGGVVLGESKEQLIAKYDRDKDGKVSSYELKAAGAMVVTDSNQDGQFHDEKAQAIDSVQTAGGKRALTGLSLDGKASVSGAEQGGGNWGWAQGSGRCGGGWG